MKEIKQVTVVIGQRGGGQILGAFTNRAKISVLKKLTKEFHEEGYIVFQKIKLDQLQKEKFGLYFK